MNITSRTTVWFTRRLQATFSIVSLFDKQYWIQPCHKKDGFREPLENLTWSEKYWLWFHLKNDFQHTIQCRLGPFEVILTKFTHARNTN